MFMTHSCNPKLILYQCSFSPLEMIISENKSVVERSRFCEWHEEVIEIDLQLYFEESTSLLISDSNQG